MAFHEIDSFVHKFKTLCQGGRNANLTLSSKAGKAVVTLTAEVDVHPPHPHVQSRNGPSCQRRRERRAAEREAAAAVNAAHQEVENVVIEKVAAEIHSETVVKPQEPIAAKATDVPAAEEAKNKEAVEAKVEEAFVLEAENEAENACVNIIEYASGEDKVEIQEVEAEVEVEVDNEKSSKILDDSGKDVHEDSNGIEEVKEDENEAEIGPTNEKAEDTTSEEHPAVVVVFATAVIENSPTEDLSQSEIKNLQTLVFRENHLKTNILKLEIGEYFTHRLRNSHFKHTLELKLFVGTTRLWEGARSYIWRHFGQSEWSNGKGGRVVFNRIHVK